MMSNRVILIDADVVSHFIYAGEIAMLNEIFEIPIFMLDKVYAELERFPKKKNYIEGLVRDKLIQVLDFPEDHDEIKKEYFYIKKMLCMGDGESACLAIARFTKDVLASSNLSDTKEYCNRHSMDYLTTMDFLCKARSTGLFSVERCNNFILKVRAAKCKLPVEKIEDYICKELPDSIY